MNDAERRALSALLFAHKGVRERFFADPEAVAWQELRIRLSDEEVAEVQRYRSGIVKLGEAVDEILQPGDIRIMSNPWTGGGGAGGGNSDR